MKEALRKKYLFAKQVFSRTGIYLGLFGAIITILSIYGFEKLFPEPKIRVAIITVIFTVSFLFAWIRNYFGVTVRLGGDHTVDIKYGDLFSKQGVIVIPFNRFFDTEINDKVLGEDSSVAKFKKACFSNSDELDRLLSAALIGIKSEKRKTKKDGKDQAYPIGTVAKIEKGANYYFCVAQTDVDENGDSFCTLEWMQIVISSVLKSIDKHAHERNVYMPILGAGKSRLGLQMQIVLEYLVSVMKATNGTWRSKLHIVLRKEDRDKIDLTKFR